MQSSAQVLESRVEQKQKFAEAHKEGGDIIKSMVYGGLDGILALFSVCAGAAGAHLIGLANMFAEAFGMAMGDYLSTKTEGQLQQKEREREEYEVETMPDVEKQEMVDIYVEKGMEPKDAQRIAELLSYNKKAWVDIMMIEELGLLPVDPNPEKGAIVTFISFACMGLIPLLPYLINISGALKDEYVFYWSIGFTFVALNVLGYVKAKFTEFNPIKSILETLVVGLISAGGSYGLGAIAHVIISH